MTLVPAPPPLRLQQLLLLLLLRVNNVFRCPVGARPRVPQEDRTVRSDTAIVVAQLCSFRSPHHCPTQVLPSTHASNMDCAAARPR